MGFKAGMLKKDPVKGKSLFGSSQDRMFILDGVKLSYYVERDGMAPAEYQMQEPKGTFGLSKFSETILDHKGFLTVFSGEQRLVLRGEDLEGWKKAIDEAIVSLGGGLTSSDPYGP
jgi:hypothetical protein